MEEDYQYSSNTTSDNSDDYNQDYNIRHVKRRKITNINQGPDSDSFIEHDDLFTDMFNKAPDEIALELQTRELNNHELVEYQNLQQLMQEEQPTIKRIINSNLDNEEKKRAIYLLQQLLNLTPASSEYYQLICEINDMIRKAKTKDQQQIQLTDLKERQIKQLVQTEVDVKTRILNLDASKSTIAIIYNQWLELQRYETNSSMWAGIMEEIEWSLSLPHNKTVGIELFERLPTMSSEQLNQFYSRKMYQLNTQLYGMSGVKRQLLQMFHDRISNGFKTGRNIALRGPPGVGKTAIGKAFAKTMGLPFEKISVGGLEDATILKGSDRVWNSAQPSIILQILARLKCSDCVIMLDEIDKLGYTPKGKEVQYALLHISDYSHNHEFRDNFLNKYPHDLSRVFFIFGLNEDVSGLDSAFLNRLDICDIKDYSLDDKRTIMCEYMLPTSCKTLGLNEKDIVFTPAGINWFMEWMLNKESIGLRCGEKAIKSIVSQINLYHSIVLANGTTGCLDLGFSLSKSSYPVKLTKKLLKHLL